MNFLCNLYLANSKLFLDVWFKKFYIRIKNETTKKTLPQSRFLHNILSRHKIVGIVISHTEERQPLSSIFYGEYTMEDIVVPETVVTEEKKKNKRIPMTKAIKSFDCREILLSDPTGLDLSNDVKLIERNRADMRNLYCNFLASVPSQINDIDNLSVMSIWFSQERYDKTIHASYMVVFNYSENLKEDVRDYLHRNYFNIFSIELINMFVDNYVNIENEDYCVVDRRKAVLDSGFPLESYHDVLRLAWGNTYNKYHEKKSLFEFGNVNATALNINAACNGSKTINAPIETIRLINYLKDIISSEYNVFKPDGIFKSLFVDTFSDNRIAINKNNVKERHDLLDELIEPTSIEYEIIKTIPEYKYSTMNGTSLANAKKPEIEAFRKLYDNCATIKNASAFISAYEYSENLYLSFIVKCIEHGINYKSLRQCVKYNDILHQLADRKMTSVTWYPRKIITINSTFFGTMKVSNVSSHRNPMFTIKVCNCNFNLSIRAIYNHGYFVRDNKLYIVSNGNEFEFGSITLKHSDVEGKLRVSVTFGNSYVTRFVKFANGIEINENDKVLGVDWSTADFVATAVAGFNLPKSSYRVGNRASIGDIQLREVGYIKLGKDCLPSAMDKTFLDDYCNKYGIKHDTKYRNGDIKGYYAQLRDVAWGVRNKIRNDLFNESTAKQAYSDLRAGLFTGTHRGGFTSTKMYAIEMVVSLSSSLSRKYHNVSSKAYDLRDMCENIKKYRERYLASKIIDKAIELGCQFVVCEDIGFSQQYKSKKTNRLLASVRPSMFMTVLKNMCKNARIICITTECAYTSRYDFTTGKEFTRTGTFNEIVVAENSVLNGRNANTIAACNIALNALCHKEKRCKALLGK